MIRSQMSEHNALAEGLTFRICRFIESSLPLRVEKMAAEYIMDDNQQLWFTHAAEMITSDKEESWQPASGNIKKPNEIRSVQHKLLKPHVVRIQPSKDGTQLCAGDYCHDTALQAREVGLTLQPDPINTKDLYHFRLRWIMGKI